jgi:hypothetical protein
MVIFEEFPAGDSYWLVKAVDRFRAPHAMTESASVGILLQEVDENLGRRTSRLKHDQIASLLGLSSGGTPPTFRVARIHVGSLPSIRTGQIYQQKSYRAELPTQTRTLKLPKAEKSMRAVQLDEQLPPPAGWNPRMPHRLLQSGEYFVEPNWRAQRVATMTTSEGHEVVIPRIAIFQRFYGPHSEMADALTSGPWDEVRHRLLCDKELASGLQTRDAVELGEWHLVLQTLIPDDFRWHIALFNFDPYAQRQVRTLHSESLVQRHGRSDGEWFCTATLPFNPEYPLTLRVKGYELTKTRARPNGAFLVTSILGASAPTYVPDLAWERTNSGATGNEIVPIDGPRPYGNKGSRNPRNDPLPRVGAEHAPPTNAPVTGFVTDTFEWLGVQKERKLEKESSKQYSDGASGGTPPQPGPGPDSTAKPVSGGQAGASLRMAAKVRPAVVQFENLLHCLASLKQSGAIDDFDIVQPDDPAQRAERGGRIVWDLIEKEVLDEGVRPKRGWRMLAGRAGRDEIPAGRTVLITEVKRKGESCLLFEVEYRQKESGFLLAALSLPRERSSARQPICKAMLSNIISSEGKHLDVAARQVAAAFPPIRGGATKHQFVVDEKGTRLERNVVIRLLNSCCGEPPSPTADSSPASAKTASETEAA